MQASVVLVVRVPAYRTEGSGLDFWHYQIFWETMHLELGPLSLNKFIKELPEWRSRGLGLENLRLTAMTMWHPSNRRIWY
jgi:hypothetical protein